MSLWEKIVVLYPEIEFDTEVIVNKCVLLQNDLDGRGDYIAKWEHPTFTRPTEEQLSGIQ
jgi:hypothetical protein